VSRTLSAAPRGPAGAVPETDMTQPATRRAAPEMP
jgi:hypothetical protein